MIGAVDIGGTKIAVGMVDGNGRVLARTQAPTDPERYSEGIERIVKMLRETEQEAGAEITGIGIGSTGPVDPMRGEFGDVDFLPGWRGKSPVNDLARIFNVGVALENDGDAAALAEAGWGAGRNRTRLIYVTVGTGIGGGIVLDGKLYRGVDGAHPEIGHHVLDWSGPPCYCGARGCWECLASGPAMTAWMQAQDASRGRTPEQICELARGGEPLARRAVEREGFYIGLGVANLVNMFLPGEIALGGGVMKSADLFLDRIRQVVREICTQVPAEKTTIALASLGADTGLLGAARAWSHRSRR